MGIAVDIVGTTYFHRRYMRMIKKVIQGTGLRDPLLSLLRW